MAIASWILAVVSAVFASVSWRLRSAVSAVARIAPFVTVSPTLTLTLVARHVVELPLPLAAVVLAMWAASTH